jgi:hypothetical protein
MHKKESNRFGWQDEAHLSRGKEIFDLAEVFANPKQNSGLTTGFSNYYSDTYRYSGQSRKSSRKED